MEHSSVVEDNLGQCRSHSLSNKAMRNAIDENLILFYNKQNVIHTVVTFEKYLLHLLYNEL